MHPKYEYFCRRFQACLLAGVEMQRQMKRVLIDKRLLALLVSGLLIGGFLLTSLASYFVSRQSLRDAIIQNELPLTSDNIYSEIQKDLIQPILISSVMASDTFVRNWALAGELEPERMVQYLGEIKRRYHAFTAFFVSDKTHIYYHADGVLKSIAETEPRDEWYFRVRTMTEPYEINVDPDMANKDAMTIFINYRVRDYDGNFIGATGIGLTVNAVRSLIDQYQERFGRTVYFVDPAGRVVLIGKGDSVPEQDIHARGDLAETMPTWSRDRVRSLEYVYKGVARLLNIRFIPELNWYLIVEKDADSDLAGIRQALYLNILVCAVVTILVLLAVWLTISRYQRRLESMATTDRLTGLATRHAYEILMEQAIRDANRLNQPLTVLMLDVDRFKSINDEFGHLAGDRVLLGVANAMRASLRSSDIISRWGGEEFLVVLRNCDLANAQRIAETIRQTIVSARFAFDGRSIPATVSIGVAVMQKSEKAEQLLARADSALYEAKQAGRNCVRVSELAVAA